MPEIIYCLCALTASLCMLLLLQAYFRTGYRLLLWGGLCFFGFTVNNVLLVVDTMIPEIPLIWLRLSTSLLSMLVLLYGLIWDKE